MCRLERQRGLRFHHESFRPLRHTLVTNRGRAFSIANRGGRDFSPRVILWFTEVRSASCNSMKVIEVADQQSRCDQSEGILLVSLLRHRSERGVERWSAVSNDGRSSRP